MKLNTLLIASAFAFCGLAHADANLVTNGSFELGTGGIGSFSGWTTNLADDGGTFVDSSGATGTHPGQATDGIWSAYFGSTLANGGGTISQQLATQIGQTYLLSFDFANDNGGGSTANGFAVSLGNTVVDSFTALGTQDYRHEQIRFTATSPSTLLSFYGYNDNFSTNGYVQLDNVAVTAAVPEPSSVVLMLAGLTLFGVMRANRRCRV